MRVLLKGARTIGGAHGAVLELCILTMCLPWEAVAIELADIDWGRGCVPVPARGGSRRLLHLPPQAMRTLARVAGTVAGRGQAVTAGRGDPIGNRDVRLDRMQARLAVAAPETIVLQPWNFHGLRAAAARELLERGCRHQDVAHALGLKVPGSDTVPIGRIRTDADDADRAAATVGKWNAILADAGPRGDPARAERRRRMPG
ncbi:tyrosine-type recombinase/integrase [Sphingomonas sp. CFBP 8760]|uniref:tyrosine-type recombinase/integrase n=1 Tax=Sphingomonas sp. CFBP 8760 TaxID=2775282 RepID=UPI00177A86A4|nr:site-specific integrase [Sphingomonas sp. CFBP 8760]MBD8546041.1 tyrosine-type recombinase/integrase [Sphingomonas sp. CFBP 8760]